LNRETEFLLASLLATIAILSPKPVARRYWMYLVVDLILSIGVYVGVRLVIHGEVQVIQSMTFGGKWALESLIVVVLLLAAGVVMALRLYNHVLPGFVFLVLSLPYLLAVFIGGVFRELRLMVPVLLCLLCIYLFLGRASEDLLRSDAGLAPE
jgi:hypothetical protein